MKILLNHTKIIENNISELRELINKFPNEHFNLIIEIAKEISKTLNSGGCIFWYGNGGSAADSQHFAAELIGRFKDNRNPYRSLSLTADSSVITCISNDFGYENLFSRQLDGLGKKGDMIIALSTSGKSQNIKNVLKMAKAKEIKSVSFLGRKGGDIKNFADFNFIVNSNTTARIQEMHALICHIICEIVEEELNVKK